MAYLILAGCNIDQKSVTSNFFHNTTAHYNGFFYAREKAREVEKAFLKTLDDDPTQILRLFPGLDTIKAKAFVKDTDEIIKMASISIQRHPNSKWVDDNYIQVGLARLYSCDFQNAILTFKYVNTKSPSPEVRHLALVYLLRTFTEMGDFDRGEEVFRFLEKEKLSRENAKRLYLEKAYHYQLKNDYDNMVHNLSKADTLLRRSDRRGRIYFIVGQVYQKLGFHSEAYNFYRKCLGTNPEYEIDFYARLNMAQVAKLDDKQDAKLVRRQFAKMLDDAKNSEFRDKIHYEWGEFERKQGLVVEAITQYTQAAHAGKSKRIQGQAYLRTGQLYFDTLKKYSLAKLYYDSAVGALPKDFENLDLIKKRQELLGQFAKYTQAIILNDSLLYLASLDTAVARAKLDSAFAARDKKATASKKKKRRSETGGGGGNLSPIIPGQSTGTSDWYFGNPDLVASGESEFQRTWGNIPLEDNWRRSNKTAVTDAVAAGIAPPVAQPDAGEKTKLQELTPAKEESGNETAKLIALLPRSEKQQKEALAKIEEGYYKLGDLYYFNLNEKRNAYDSYSKLLERFPSSEFKPEALYKLFLIFRDTDPDKAAVYAQMLKDQFPNATVTKIMLNPNYLMETSVAAEKQKLIYKGAYANFQQNNLRAAQDQLELAYREGETGFTPQLDLLKILIVGKTEDVSKYQYELETFIKKYPAEPSKPYAEELLASSKTLLARLEKAKGIQFSKALNGAHYFVSIHKTSDKITNAVNDALDQFSNTHWKDAKLTTSNLALNDESIVTMVVEFPDREMALGYFDKFLAQLSKVKPFANYKFYNFVITKENFQLFYRTKALDEYLTFFDRNYQKQSQ